MHLYKNEKSVKKFDFTVLQELIDCGVDCSMCSDSIVEDAGAEERIGVAVSGGADSISLLTAISHVIPNMHCVFVITVNHNLRPIEETGGDAEYVENYCKQLGISCTRIEIPRGKISALAKEHAMSIEEAARKIRYDAFAAFCKEKNIAHLCLAHNKNDQIETVVMRFFRGSSALYGIPKVRKLGDEGTQIIRPLLSLTRIEIEQYLADQQIPFRTDKTNFDNAMTRNCIRNVLMPVFDKELPGWKSAAISLSSKIHADEEAIETLVVEAVKKVAWTEEDNAVSFNANSFSLLLSAVKRRLVYRAIERIGTGERVPYSFVEKVCALSGEKAESVAAAGVRARSANGVIFIQKKIKDATESGFFVIIKEIGRYEAGPWLFTVKKNEANDAIAIEAERISSSSEEILCEGQAITLATVSFPFAIRSRQPGDVIKTAAGQMKSVASVLENMCSSTERNLIPLVQKLQSEEQCIVCIWGRVIGYDNWIVKE